MAADSFELDPTEDLSAVTVGEPGARQFFLHARAAERELTLACEKAHVQSLVGRIRQLLVEQEVSGPEVDPEPPPSKQPNFEAEPAWRVAELGLGYQESRKLYVVVAREDTGDEEREGAVARLWVTAEQLRAFARRADQVLSAGRPVCSRCGLPIDPAGHPCPAANGSRPIL